MKSRNVCTVAAFGVVPVVLAGERGSHGSRSGRRSDSTRTGHQRTGHLKPDATNALRDVRIVNCAYDDAIERLAARCATAAVRRVYGLTAKFTSGTGDAAVSTPTSRGDVVIDEGVWADLGLQALARCPVEGVPPSPSVPSPVGCRPAAGR